MREEVRRILFVSSSNPKVRGAISFLSSTFPKTEYHVIKVFRTPSMREVPEEVIRIADDAHKEVIKEFSSRGIKPREYLGEGTSSAEIVEYSERINADLIVLPTTLLVKHTERMSSTLKEVLMKCGKPLMIYSPFTKFSESIEKILLIYRHSKASILAGFMASELAEELGSSLLILYFGRKIGMGKIAAEADRRKVPIEVEEGDKKELYEGLTDKIEEEEIDLAFIGKDFSGKIFLSKRIKLFERLLSKAPVPFFVIEA